MVSATLRPCHPPGRALASGDAGGTGPGGTVLHGRGKRRAFPGPARPDESAFTASWQGPSPLPQRPADPWPAGDLKPPASARPAPGGRWPAVCLDLPIYGEPSRIGGEARCVSCSRPKRRRNCAAAMAGAIAPATAPRCPHARRGPKAPGQRPPRPRRALLARRVGRWPLLVRVARVLGAAFRAGGGNAVRFLFPPGGGRGRSESEPPAPLPWQGPSPLPPRHTDAWPAGGPKPPASARPAPGGRFSPAGSGAGLCRCGWHGSWWQRSARAGETRCVSFSRPDGGRKIRVRTTFDVAMAGAIAPATASRRSLASRGPKAPGQRPPRPRRALACRCAWTCRSTGNRRARAAETHAFPVPARTDKSTFTASLAGAIAPATSPR
jgi:hypothetical protein